MLRRHFEVRQHGPVTEFVMGPASGSRVLFPFRAYLVDGLLIDTGPPSQARDMARVLAEYPIAAVVNTHHHEDHAGNNGLVNQLLGISPLAHPLAVPLLAELPAIQFYRRLTWGEATPSLARPIGDVVETPKYRFEVLHTPGHSPDHLVLHEREQGWLFTGDLFIADRLKLLRLEEDPEQLIRSLDSTLTRSFDQVFCAHRGPVASGHAALSRKREYMLALRAQVLDLYGQGLSDQAIARRLLGREDFLYLFSAGDFCRRNLITAFLPHWPGPAPLPPSRHASR